MLNPQNLVSMRRVSLDGKPTSSQVSMHIISLNQPLEEAEKGRSVGITVDYLLSAEALHTGLQFKLQKGDIGGCLVTFYSIEEGEEKLIQTTSHKGVVAGSAGLNPLNFAVDLSALRAVAPLSGEVRRIPQQKLLLAYYYPWYTLESWSSPFLKDNPLKPYHSSSRDTILRHVEQAKVAGIDGFISSWWGPGSETDTNLVKLLEIAMQQEFKVVINFETLAGENEGPLNATELERWLAYALSHYSQHPAILRVEGKPVIVLWATGTVPLESWEAIFTSLRAQGLDAVYLGMGYDLSNLEVFDGVYEYVVFNIPNLERTAQSMGRAVHYFSLLSESAMPKIWAATVQPGYDDTLIPGREGQVQERLNGDFYRFTWESALASDPDWIFITTWNEWWEHTYIEPSQLYGDLYVQITSEYASQWKGDG